MSRHNPSRDPNRRSPGQLELTGITVRGFKSLADETSIEIRPLTLLAGANSSGKSSILQPLLLMKQTLESSYNFGPLVLNGANVKFTSFEQILSNCYSDNSSDSFRVQLSLSRGRSFATEICKEATSKLKVRCTEYETKDGKIKIEAGLSSEELKQQLAKSTIQRHVDWRSNFLMNFLMRHHEPERLSVEPYLTATESFFYLVPALAYERDDATIIDEVFDDLSDLDLNDFNPAIQSLIHVPGLRDNPERSYPLTAVGRDFPGTFEKYTASVICDWQNQGDERLQQLGQALENLSLTWKVEATQLNDVHVELRVNPRPREAQFNELVSVADVGIGVSQVLPVVVALLAAAPGQLVYLEQPELHLHPRAQAALGDLLAEAARRGARVVVETHSDLLLRRVQTLIAEGVIASEQVMLHWFTRGNHGATTVQSVEFTESGGFGDAPIDFSDTLLSEESRYLDAAWQRSKVNSLKS